MFLVVVLSLAALASAGPVIQQHQEVEHVNAIPFYKQMYNPYSMNIYGNYRNNKYFPYYGQMKERYPYLPYNYDNTMTYPYRSNYFLRYMNKPEMGMQQPKVDYDLRDIYHLDDVNRHHMINKNIHEFKQMEFNRKLNEMDYPYLPYSPMYNDKYMYKFYNRGYPYINNYGKSLEQGYVQPWTNKYYNRYWGTDYNRYWDTDYIRNYYNRNLDYFKPITPWNMGVEYVKPTFSRNWDRDYSEPAITKHLDLEYVKPVMTKTLNVDYVKPVISKKSSVEYVQPAISKYLDLQYVKPILSKNLDVEYVKPVVNTNLNIDYVKPVISRKLDFDMVKPIFARGLDMEYTEQPAFMRNMDFDYVQSNQRQSQEAEFIPEVRNLDFESAYVPNDYLYDLDLERSIEDIPIEGRFRRDLVAQVGTNVEQKHETPQHTATEVERSHQTPVQVPVEVEHVSPQPIQRQTRDTTTQSVVFAPQYLYYPYYLNPYLPVQTPLVVRNADYPNYYYNLLYRK